jgi:CRISPR-associated protein Csm2
MNARFHNSRQGQGSGAGRPPGGRDVPPGPTLDTSGICFQPLNPDLFDGVARRTAEKIAEGIPRRNKSTQLRRFYDEIVMWDQRIRQLREDERASVYGAKYLPLIKMLNAKAAYAESRELVDRNFVELLRHGLSQLSPDQPETFYNFKLFMEAFMGFFKLAEAERR